MSDYLKRTYAGPVGQDGWFHFQILVTDDATADDIKDLRGMVAILDRQLGRIEAERVTRAAAAMGGEG